MRGAALRQRRLECELTQGQLAARAGVSRQLVAAVERGRHAPAVDAAMRLAQVLGTTVEALFTEREPELASAFGGRIRDGVPVRVGAVGARHIVAELADHGIAGTGWARADGVIRDGRLELFAGATPAGAIVAGCEPALGLAEGLLAGLGERSLLALSAPTDRSLRALAEDSAHGAVAHGVAGALPDPPVPVSRWQVARWQVGLASGSGRRTRSLGAALHAVTTIVQREPGAASQQAFERALLRAGLAVSTPGPVAGGHLEAARLAATLGGAAVTTEGAAHAFGLRFLALEEHTVELWVAERWREHPGIDALLELLAGRAFTDRVAQFGGYDLERCGDSV